MVGEQFSEAGFVVLPDMLGAGELQIVDAALDGITASLAGARQMLALDWCAALEEKVRQQLVAAELIPFDHVAVQCTFFEKSREHNWLVPLHQDLSIPVQRRVEHAELTGWSEKNGVLDVQPPVALLEQLVALGLYSMTVGMTMVLFKWCLGRMARGGWRQIRKWSG